MLMPCEHPSSTEFQSTPSGRKATRVGTSSVSPRARFNPRLPGGRRPATPGPPSSGRQFQSTPSGRKATGGQRQHAGRVCVSIHAFREEGDRSSGAPAMSELTFQSTPSGRKATRDRLRIGAIPAQFQSTPSGRKATRLFERIERMQESFQSTPSGRKATRYAIWALRGRAAFQSTPSGRKATGTRLALSGVACVSIHAFREEGDPEGYRHWLNALQRFNPRLPGGRRRW